MSNTANPLIPRDGKLTVTDGSTLTLLLLYEDGDFQVSNLTEAQMSIIAFKARGKTYSVRKVEDQNIDFSFTCHAIHIIGDGTTATIGDIVLKLGAWAAATSKLPTANGDAHLVQVAWTGERTAFGATNDSGIAMKYCSLTMDFSEGVPGKISVKGTLFPISTDYLVIT